MVAGRRVPKPHPLLIRFVAITLLLVAALGWFGWRLLQQDRALERQRTRDRLENSADLIAAALLRGVAGVQDTLARLVALPRDDAGATAERIVVALPGEALMLVATADRFDAYPRDRLLYHPVPPAAADPPAAIFARGDSLEFRARDPAAASTVYRAIASSRQESVRAAALMRLGRAARKTHGVQVAATAYDELARIDDALVNGVPAELVARAARLALWREMGDTGALRREANELHDGLHAARWSMPRSAFEFHDAEVSRMLTLPPAPHGDPTVAGRMALSDAAASLWRSWAVEEGDRLSSSGARAVTVADRPLVIIWNVRRDRIAAVIAGPELFVSSLLPDASSLLERQQLSLTDDQDRIVFASHAAAVPGAVAAARVSRAASATRLPWTLHVTSRASDLERAGEAERRRLLIAGMGVAALLALFGTYAVSRAASRELSAAQLQADFVAAVSHEFRTPLTSLKQLTELLASGRVASPERRAEYYEAIRRETARLHRFVEALLDFGRADAGVADRHMAPVDAITLVRDTVTEFEREAVAAGYRIDVVAPPQPFTVNADAEALRRALWNLLDNAVKYSAEHRAVKVEAVAIDTQVVIRVSDRGIGVPPDEQLRIFEKFQRGAVARERGIRGTGIGLAIVRQIVVAHGGTVSLESAPGAGSTFTITLPALVATG